MANEQREGHQETRVERAMPVDAQSIAQIQDMTWRATYPNEDYEITVDDLEKSLGSLESQMAVWQERLELSEDGDQTLVARRENQVVGFCRLRKGGAVNHLEAIYVHPNFQGAGAGRELMLRALATLSDKHPIELDVAEYNERAIAIYEGYGFVPTGERSEMKLSRTKVIPFLRMRRAGKESLVS